MSAITKKYTFSAPEQKKLENIEIGLANADAMIDGLNTYRNMLLRNVYKRIGLPTEPQKNHLASLTYTLHPNEIIYKETPDKARKVAKK